jgi:hypothetical protein
VWIAGNTYGFTWRVQEVPQNTLERKLVSNQGTNQTQIRWLSLYAQFVIHVLQSAVLFKNYEEQKYLIRGHILKLVTCIRLSPGLSGKVMQMISRASKNSGAILTSKWRLLYVSHFTRFHYKRRFAGTRPPRITSLLCGILPCLGSFTLILEVQCSNLTF